MVTNTMRDPPLMTAFSAPELMNGMTPSPIPASNAPTTTNTSPFSSTNAIHAIILPTIMMKRASPAKLAVERTCTSILVTTSMHVLPALLSTNSTLKALVVLNVPVATCSLIRQRMNVSSVTPPRVTSTMEPVSIAIFSTNTMISQAKNVSLAPKRTCSITKNKKNVPIVLLEINTSTPLLMAAKTAPAPTYIGMKRRANVPPVATILILMSITTLRLRNVRPVLILTNTLMSLQALVLNVLAKICSLMAMLGSA
mmetsp:Transcript_23831/g.20774  ORF Transcript_23831/g.20774 Transcript_23831/m.20774 type:complete len:255 (+) Transcript_23831:582-1346(+)